MENTENMHLVDYVVAGMRTTADELEKLQVQAALGKMEALDKFEEIKQKYSSVVFDLKDRYYQAKSEYEEIRGKVEDLIVQFNLGKADTIEAFEEQKKKILLAIHEIQVKITTNPTFIKGYAILLDVLERLKVKLEVLSEAMAPAKDKMVENFNERKAQVEDLILSWKEKFKDKTDIENRIDVFQSELSEAYKHFKKAFVQG